MNEGTTTQTADNSRRTPAELLARARQVLGTIDLDPASDEHAQQAVQATHWCGSLDPAIADHKEPLPTALDGLLHPWCGKVWLNPPGGYHYTGKGKQRVSSAAVWWAKLHGHYQRGEVAEALFLAFSLNVFRTGQTLTLRPPYAYPFLVFRERLRFPASLTNPNASTTTDSPNVDSALVYLPPKMHAAGVAASIGRFAKAFEDLGYVHT